MAEGGAVRELLAVFGFEVDTKELKRGETAIGNFVERAKKVAEGLAAAFAVEKVYEWAESQVKAATEVERTASALGITTEKVQELQYASKALGMDGDALLNMLGKLQVNQFKAAEGAGEQAKAFSQLGVSVRDAHGKLKPVDELLPDIAEGIKNTSDPAKQAALATELFGKQGRSLLPFLKEGREGVEKYAEEFRELGGGFNDKTIAQAREFEHQSARLSATFRSLASTILQGLLPILQPLIGSIARGVMMFRQWAEGSEIVKAAMLVLGGVAMVFALQMAAANLPILAVVAAVGALVLLVDDLINLFQGNDSLIGRWLDAAFGKGASADMVKLLRDVWKEVVSEIKQAWTYAKELADVLVTIVKYLPAIYVLRKLPAAAGRAGDLLARIKGAVGESEYENSEEHRQRLAGTFVNPANVPVGQPGSAEFGPAAPPRATHVKEGDVHFHVAGDLTPEVHERAAKQWHEHRKRERRETAASLQRAASR